MSESQIILIVEDSDDDFFAIMRAFKTVNLVNSVRRCTNGDQALDYLFQRDEFSTPDTAPRPGIILLDLNLPGTDGQELLRVIKANQDLLKIPVIVLTTSGAEKDIEQCYAAGANFYIQKPVDLTGFSHAIAHLCEDWLEVFVLPKNIRQDAFDGTTDRTTQFWLSAKAQALIDSHSTRPSFEERLAGQPKDADQVAAYVRATV